MTILKVTKLTTIIYLIITSLLAATLYWSIVKFREISQKKYEYNRIWSMSFVDLKEIIENYLSLGEATQLQNAIKLINDTIKPALVTLPHKIKSKLDAHLDEIVVNLEGDIRAAGKLSGDPFALINNNALQLAQTLEIYIDYIYQVESQSTPAEFLIFFRKNIELNQHLDQLTILSKQYLKINTKENRTALVRQLSAFQDSINSLSSLPNVDVAEEHKEESNDLAALMGWAEDSEAAKEDNIEEIKNELTSWVTRYLKDVDNSLNTIVDARHARDVLRSQISTLQAELLVGTQQLQNDADSLQKQIIIIFITFIILIETFA